MRLQWKRYVKEMARQKTTSTSDIVRKQTMKYLNHQQPVLDNQLEVHFNYSSKVVFTPRKSR